MGGGDPGSFNAPWRAAYLHRAGLALDTLNPGGGGKPRLYPSYPFRRTRLGHLALGLAKASRQPVAVIVTSGTATANLYPALIEAGLTGEKLILLTADVRRS
ncbi:hypothetical protein G7B21_02085 [Klebsiella pneumoniae]|nr:hypothetical protein [Klebsiella pneumoniae]